MRMGWMILLLVWSVAAPAVVPVGDDEAWIERYMAQPGRSAAPAEVRRGYRVAWSDMRRFRGVPVKVTTHTGAVHHGTIDEASATHVVLRSRLHGGYAQLTLSAAQVRSTELE